MRTQRSTIVAALAAAALAGGACAPASGPMGFGNGGQDLLVPPGHGTLRQEEITLTLRREALQLKVTPLEEWVLRLTAPDTHDRLSELAASHRGPIQRETGVAEPTLFLVSFFSDEPNVPYEPEDVSFVSRGLRYRPLHVRPVSSGWGTQRLNQREPRLAVYAFPAAADLEQGLVLEYGDARNHQWDAILQVLQAEHARARARAGMDAAGYPSSSSPKRLILR